MAEIAPVRALRYARDPLADVVAPPYDVIGPELRARLGARSAHNVVHLDLPAGEGDARYANAAATLATWRHEGVLALDERPALHRYEQTFDPPGGGERLTRVGFFALVKGQPYSDRVVLPHERTLSGPKEDRYRLMVTTRAALSPVFLLYSDPSSTVRDAIDGGEPVADFATDDAVRHVLSRVSDPARIRTVVERLGREQVVIADGHHRYETGLRYAAQIDDERARAGLAAGGPRASHRYVLAFLSNVDDPGLAVFPTHRLVHSLAGFEASRLLERASPWFDVVGWPSSTDPADVARRTAALGGVGFGVLLPDGRAWGLAWKAGRNPAEHPGLAARPAVLRGSDVVVLHDVLLDGVLGIDAKAQLEQRNLGYVKDLREAVTRVRAGEGDVLFLLNPTPVAQVREVASSGEVMPQKSTYFYPKVLTGLLVHDLDPTVDAPRA